MAIIVVRNLTILHNADGNLPLSRTKYKIREDLQYPRGLTYDSINKIIYFGDIYPDNEEALQSFQVDSNYEPIRSIRHKNRTFHHLKGKIEKIFYFN